MPGHMNVLLQFAARLLGAILRAAREAFGAVLNRVVKWARLVWVLVQSYRDLRPAWRELRAAPVAADW